MNNRKVIGRLLLSTAIIFSSAPLFAQSTPGSIADPDRIIDENGVDLISGKYHAVVAKAGSRDFAFQARWFGSIDDSILNSRIVISGNDVFVSIGGETIKFTKVGSNYVPDDAKGATLTRGTGSFTFRSKASDAAYFEDDPTNLAGNAPGITSARLISMTFSRPTAKPLQFIYKTVSSGGFVYSRVSMILSGYVNELGEGYDAFKPSYASDVAYDPNFKKLSSIKAFYQGPYAMQHACSSYNDSCPTLDAREQLTISSSTAGGVETISLTDKGGHVTVVTKGGNGVTAIRAPGDTADGISVTYDGSGQVSTITRFGRTFTYTFGTVSGNRTASVALTGGGSKYYVIDPSRRILISARNEEMETTSYSYDSEDRLTQISQPEGNYLTYTYDARSNVTAVSQVPKAGPDSTIYATFGFPSGCTNADANCNKAISSTDGRGFQTDYVNGQIEDSYYVDEIRYPAATAGGDRLVVKNKYSNIYGRVQDGGGNWEYTSVVSTELTRREVFKAPLGNFSSLSSISEHDFYFDDIGGEHEILPMNSLLKGPDGSGGYLYQYSSSNNYDTGGRLQSTADWQFGNAGYQYFYDANNRMIGSIGPDHDGAGPMQFSATRVTYGSRGLVDQVEVGTATSQTQAALTGMTVLQTKENFYDSNRRLVKTQVRAGGAIVALAQFSHNARGLVECSAQRMNPSTFSSPPASACSLATTGSFGPDRIVKNHYDAVGRLLRVEGAYGTAEVADDLVYTYNDNGTIASMTDAKGNRTTYEYDGHDRLKKKIFPHKTNVGTSDATDYEYYYYDANSNLTQKRLRDGQMIYFTFDRLNRVVLIDLPGAESDISYTYDVEGQMKTTTRGSVTKTLSYDSLGRMISDGNNLGTVQFQYDVLNRPTRMTWPDGFYVTYEYHGMGPAKAIKENGSAAIATYGYDSFGRRNSLSFGNGTSLSYGYDTASRLASLSQDLAGTSSDQSISLSYSPASQIVSRTGTNDTFAFTGHTAIDRAYSANGLNQYTASGSVSLGYDARGNLNSSGSDSFSYTSDNLLNTGPGGATLAYDGVGTLFETSKAGVTTRFLYSGPTLIAEYSGSNVLQRRFVPGVGVDQPLLWYEGTGTSDKRYMMADERGSITALSNGSGAMFAINRYDEYGIPAAGNVGRFQYTGQAWLPELGMYHYKARMYSPTLGRFMQTDPIGYGDGVNMYAYVGSDPVNRADPTGMFDTDLEDIEEIPVFGRLLRNCFDPFGGGCFSTGRDLADEYDYAAAVNRARLAAPPAVAATSVCVGPPQGPRGVSRADLKAQVKNNVEVAENHWILEFGPVFGPIVTLKWFNDVIGSGRQYDYKQHDAAYEPFGNYNYGAMGAAAGIPEEILLRAAGRNQEQNSAYKAEYGHWYQGHPYGDDPRDVAQIKQGIADYKNSCFSR